MWEKYLDTFGDIFPTMCFGSDTPEELEDRIRLCLSKGEKAEIVFDLDYSLYVKY